MNGFRTTIPAAFLAALTLAEAARGQETQAVITEYRRAIVEQVFFTSVPLVFVVLHLLFFAFDRRSRDNLYFAAATLSFSAAAFFEYQLDFPGPLLEHLGLLLHFKNLATTLLLLSLLLFIYRLFADRLPRRFWGYVTALAVLWTRTFVLASEWQEAMRVLLFIVVCAVCLEFLYATVILIRQRQDGTWILGAGGLTFFIGGLLDQLMDAGALDSTILGTENPYLYGGLGMLLSMSIYLARSFARTGRELEHQLVQVQELSEKTLAQERAAREQEIERRVLDADHARKTAELEEARRLQLSLLPSELPALDGYDVAASMRTATEVGGDYYDFDVRGDGALIVAIGDAVGHGARAGTLVAATKSLFKALVDEDEPVEILSRFNSAIRGMRLSRAHMALTLARLDAGRLRIAAAGMPPVLVHRTATGEAEEITVEGLPLGGPEGFPHRQEEVAVSPGDTVLFMTDGFPELRNGAGEEVGYERTRALFQEACGCSARDVLQRLEETVDEWMDGQPPGDDVTFVVVKIRGCHSSSRRDGTG